MIVVCEPYFRGVSHVRFNAALIGLVTEAFPEERVIFCAERGHANEVQKMLNACRPAVKFIEVRLPGKAAPNGQRPWRLPFARSLEQLAFYREIFRLANKNQASLIVFCTTAYWTALVSIKVM